MNDLDAYCWPWPVVCEMMSKIPLSFMPVWCILYVGKTENGGPFCCVSSTIVMLDRLVFYDFVGFCTMSLFICCFAERILLWKFKCLSLTTGWLNCCPEIPISFMSLHIIRGRLDISGRFLVVKVEWMSYLYDDATIDSLCSAF